MVNSPLEDGVRVPDIDVIPSFILLTTDDVPNLKKDDPLVVISPSIRDDVEEVQAVKVEVFLKDPAPAGGTKVSIRADGVDGKGKRDIDYIARVVDSSLDVEEGKPSGVATIEFTSLVPDDDKTNWEFMVFASLTGPGLRGREGCDDHGHRRRFGYL